MKSKRVFHCVCVRLDDACSEQQANRTTFEVKYRYVNQLNKYFESLKMEVRK